MASITEVETTTVAVPQAPKATWATTVLAQGGPWDEVNDPLSYAGCPALPMPVEVSDKESLAPFFAHLRSDGSHLPVQGGAAGAEPYYKTELLEFEKGVLYADHRLDLCKMVVGPRSIGDLMDSLKSNTFTKHFLLGNNVVGSTGAAAIAAFIRERPQQIETWYLAGNCIDGEGFTTLVNAMVLSPVITNVWLKRNPLGPAAASSLYKLITLSPLLRTLDLDQTELGDKCIAELFSLLADHSQAHALQHIYLNASGFGPLAAHALSRYLASPHCKLVSVYLGDNPLGDGIAALATGLKASKTIQRLSLRSCGLKDAGTTPVLEALLGHPSLKALDLSQGYSTKDLNMRFNWLTCEAAITALVKADTLRSLSIAYNPLTQTQLLEILSAVKSSNLVYFQCRPVVQGGRSYAEIKAGQRYSKELKEVQQHVHYNAERQYDVPYAEFEAGQKRFLMSPEDVRLIDSVYRNRDAALARRGLKRLQKWWDDEETLQRIQDGEVD